MNKYCTWTHVHEHRHESGYVHVHIPVLVQYLYRDIYMNMAIKIWAWIRTWKWHKHEQNMKINPSSLLNLDFDQINNMGFNYVELGAAQRWLVGQVLFVFLPGVSVLCTFLEGRGIHCVYRLNVIRAQLKQYLSCPPTQGYGSQGTMARAGWKEIRLGSKRLNT
jgi:hypothetical protein